MKKKYIPPTIKVTIVEFENSISAASITTSANNGGLPLITEENIEEVSTDWNVPYN